MTPQETTKLVCSEFYATLQEAKDFWCDRDSQRPRNTEEQGKEEGML